MVNQVINEIFRQMTITLTLPLDVPIRPMDAKGLRVFSHFTPQGVMYQFQALCSGLLTAPQAFTRVCTN